MHRRKEPRTEFRLPVSIGRRMAALTTDVSHKGFCLELPTLLETGAPIDGYVLFGNKELPFKGEVTWLQRGNPQATVWNRMGVKFTWVCPGLRALLSLKQAKRPR